MDFHLDTLLNLPQITVSSCQQKEGLIFLKLDFLSEGILCPHCQTYTDNLHQTRPILVRDLSIFGKGVYLRVPRRQFICPQCKKYPKDWSMPERLALDEISKRKGKSKFATVVSDLDNSSLLEVIDSHNSDEIIEVLEAQPLVMRENVKEVSVDLWGGFPKVIKAVIQYFSFKS